MYSHCSAASQTWTFPAAGDPDPAPVPAHRTADEREPGGASSGLAAGALASGGDLGVHQRKAPLHRDGPGLGLPLHHRVIVLVSTGGTHSIATVHAAGSRCAGPFSL